MQQSVFLRTSSSKMLKNFTPNYSEPLEKATHYSWVSKPNIIFNPYTCVASPCFSLSHTWHCLLPFSFLFLPQPTPQAMACPLSFSFLVLSQRMPQSTPPTLFPSPAPIPRNPCPSLSQSSRSSGPPKTPRLQIRTRKRSQIPMLPLGFTACRRPINSVLHGFEFVKFLFRGLRVCEICSSWVWVCENFPFFVGLGLWNSFLAVQQLWVRVCDLVVIWFWVCGFILGFVTCLWF